MKKKNKTYLMIVWLICLFVSIDIGNHALHFITKIGFNVWISRLVGIIVCVLMGILFYHLWINKVSDK